MDWQCRPLVGMQGAYRHKGIAVQTITDGSMNTYMLQRLNSIYECKDLVHASDVHKSTCPVGCNASALVDAQQSQHACHLICRLPQHTTVLTPLHVGPGSCVCKHLRLHMHTQHDGH
jgi:hypothetical protein